MQRHQQDMIDIIGPPAIFDILVEIANLHGRLARDRQFQPGKAAQPIHIQGVDNFVKPTVINPAPLTVRFSVFGDALSSLEH